jgi:uncharacterized metal-binding protein YceD (DUF177 family)
MQNIFSYPLIVEDLSANEKLFALKANDAERAYIKDVLKVPAVKTFDAEIKVKFSKKEHRLDVWGTIKTLLELESVISLELFNKKYNIEFALVYDTKMTRKEQKELEELQDDVPEIITHGKIDLADIAIEQIALNMDDHPRKKGEKFDFKPNFDENEPTGKNPFEVLAKLKKTQ